MAVMHLCLTLCLFMATVWSQEDSQGIGVYYYGNVSSPFDYLRGTITIPESPLPALNDQFVYYYFGLAKQRLQASAIVVFCGNSSGCWDDTINSGYYVYSELSVPGKGRYAGGEKLEIAPGDTAEVTVIQSGTYLSVNITKLSDGKDSFFDIYGANDGGLVDVVSGCALIYQNGQKNVCEDYTKQPFIVSNIVAVGQGGNVFDDLDFKLDGNENNTCGGNIQVGPNGKNLQIFGAK